jgi:hypothetical protein
MLTMKRKLLGGRSIFGLVLVYDHVCMYNRYYCSHCSKKKSKFKHGISSDNREFGSRNSSRAKC